LRDQRSILTVCTPVGEILGVCDVTLSLPHLVGSEGVLATFPLPLDEAESAALKTSAQVVCQAIEEVVATRVGTPESTKGG
jgi:L-lactate dehydrogenase